MTIDEIMKELSLLPENTVFRNGFTSPHSYRGMYDMLGVEPAKNVSVIDMMRNLKWATGMTFTGWKGGDFTMWGDTDVYLAEEGRLGASIVGIDWDNGYYFLTE